MGPQSSKYFECLSNLANFGIGLGGITARHSQIKILTGNGKPPMRHEAIVTGKMISDSLYGMPYHTSGTRLILPLCRKKSTHAILPSKIQIDARRYHGILGPSLEWHNERTADSSVCSGFMYSNELTREIGIREKHEGE